jgi:hypothetical protein
MIKISFLYQSLNAVMALACLLLYIVWGGKNEKAEMASLGVAFGRFSLSRMRNGSRHGGRYTEHRESREKDSLWRIGRVSPIPEKLSKIILVQKGPRRIGWSRSTLPDGDQSCGQ